MHEFNDDRPIPGTEPWHEKLARMDAALTPEALHVAGVLFAIERIDRAEPMAVPPAPIYRELAHNLMNPAHHAALMEALRAMAPKSNQEPQPCAHHQTMPTTPIPHQRPSTCPTTSASKKSAVISALPHGQQQP